MTPQAWRSSALRWLKFNLVGGMGMVVQLFVLVLRKAGLHVDYLIATALAVETAVVHNFLWHERVTWADRRKLYALSQIQLDYGSAFHHRKPGVDEGARRSGAHELSARQRNHNHGVLSSQLPGQRWSCVRKVSGANSVHVIVRLALD